MKRRAFADRFCSRPIWGASLIALAAVLAMAGQGSFHAPPRYDGAGYAVLARSLAEGGGYRAIDHPDRPRHAHFPPGYPLFLALVWSVSGPSATSAHASSCLCAIGATLAAFFWFRRIYPRNVVLVLGLALAVNWAWARAATGIQSEPLYELLGQLTILAACRWAGQVGIGRSLILGVLLAVCFLTRQVAIGLVIAVMLDLGLRRPRWPAVAVGATAMVLVAPWLGWLLVVGASQRTQANMLIAGSPGLLARFVSQVAFYVQRIPDQITGPFVEIATVIHPSKDAAAVAYVWAITASALVLGGWVVALCQPRRRLAGLIPLCTLGLLVAWPYTEAGRFLIPLIPCLLIGAVEGASGLIRAVRRSLGRKAIRRGTRLAAAALLLAASLPYAGYSLLKAGSAQRDDTDRDFDSACTWLTLHADHPGPILTRHPGEVYLATGRQALEVETSERPGEIDASSGAIDAAIRRYGVAYLLIDRDRYLKAHASPLDRFVADRPERVRHVWSSGPEPARVVLYEVAPEQ